MFKKIFKVINFALIAFVGIGLLIWLKTCTTTQTSSVKIQINSQVPIKQKIYQEPIIKLPFIKDKQPIATERLPIPKQDVSKTIVVSTDVEQKVEIIIDKEGNVWVPRDAPKTGGIVVTKWKPKFFEIKNRFSVSTLFAFSNGMYFALSYDPIRVNRILFGGDMGVRVQQGYKTNILIGLSAKFVYNPDDNVQLAWIAGYDFLNLMPYVGMNLKW